MKHSSLLSLFGFLLLLSLCSKAQSRDTDVESNGHNFCRLIGDVYVIDVTFPVINQLTSQLQHSLETHGQVVVKLRGRGITVVETAKDILHVLEEELKLGDHSTNIAQDITDVVNVMERVSTLVVVAEEHMQTTVDAERLYDYVQMLNINLQMILVHGESGKDLRLKRSGGVDFYQLLANVSGGSVMMTNKDNIGSAVDIIKQTLPVNMVHVMKLFTSDAPGKTFMFSVDETISKVIIQIQINGSAAVPMVTMGNGLPCPNHPRLLGKTGAGDVVSLIEYNITSPAECGMWKIMKMDGPTWDLSVKALSPVDFTYMFVEPGPGGFGEYPIKGRPIAGQTYKIVVTVREYARFSKLSVMFFMSGDKIYPVGFGALTNVGGRSGKNMWYSILKVPAEDFMIAIDGKDLSSKTARRLDPVLITPTTLLLDVSRQGTTLHANETLIIPFNVTNVGTTSQDVDVKIADDKRFSRGPLILSYTIAPGLSELGRFNILANEAIGTTVTVTITAKPFVLGGRFQTSQYAVLRFTVVGSTKPHKQQAVLDTVAPVCNVTRFLGTCQNFTNPCTCAQKRWSMEAEISDVNSGLLDISANNAGGQGNHTFTHDNFTVGQNDSTDTTNAYLESNCCFANATIIATDVAGNAVTCVQDSQTITGPFIATTSTNPSFTTSTSPSNPTTAPPNTTVPNFTHHSTPGVSHTPPTPKARTVANTAQTTATASPSCHCNYTDWKVSMEFTASGWNVSAHSTSDTLISRTGDSIFIDSGCCHREIVIDNRALASNVNRTLLSLANVLLPGTSSCPTFMTTTTKTTTTTVVTKTTGPGGTVP